MTYAVTFRNVALYLIPGKIRKDKLRDLLYSVVKGLQTVNDSFVAWKAKVDKKIHHDARVVYLERYLNTEYSISYAPATRSADIGTGTIIWIEDQANTAYIYLYNKLEEQDEVYIYNKYDAAATYAVDDQVRYGDKVYKSLVGSNTGNTPDVSPTEWSEEKDFEIWLRNHSEYEDDLDFIVKVPVALTYNEAKMTAQIDQFNLAGKRYEIQTY